MSAVGAGPYPAGMTVSAFLACSLDGFIAEPDGGLAWLTSPPSDVVDSSGLGSDDTGYDAFVADKDAIVMGRGTFDVVAGFDPWPYPLPVVVLTGRPLPEALPGGAEVSALAGGPAEVVAALGAQGRDRLYVDGGQVVTAFLAAGLLDEIVITVVPVVLGAGIPLFGAVAGHRWFHHVSTRVLGGAYVQSHYRRRD